ncbi:MAG: ATP-binding cassette domain-containing protein, partial [Deltaproteobacteria bacterium]|nr:ATP-binding cassette domain-containing protein [Deltaproteobacteria bacterium]
MKKNLEIKNLNVSFDGFHALQNVSFDIFRNEILSIIGPANSGKSTLLFCINRMIERISNVKVEGGILLDGHNVHAIKDVEELRRRIGIVYAAPIPLPMTIKENILFGPKLKKRLTAA